MKRILPTPKHLHRLHIVELEYPKKSWRYARRQGMAVLCLLGGIALSIPTMPGPGFVLVLLGILLGDYPRKKQFFLWLEQKRSFRQARVYLRRRWKLLLLLGRPWVSEEEKEREKQQAVLAAQTEQEKKPGDENGADQNVPMQSETS